MKSTLVSERPAESHAGDVLLLHTDGITENFNPSGDEFGCDRLMNLLMDSAPLNAKEIAAVIFGWLDKVLR